MSPYVAYLLGILTIIAIILPFALIARVNPEVQVVYSNIFCDFGDANADAES